MKSMLKSIQAVRERFSGRQTMKSYSHYTREPGVDLLAFWYAKLGLNVIFLQQAVLSHDKSD